MNSSILNDFCLICSDFHCQEESFHKKETFLSIQNLLLRNTLLTASFQQNLFSSQSQKSQTKAQNIKCQPIHKRNNFIPKKVYVIDEISAFISNIQTTFQKFECNNFSKIKSLDSLLIASLTILELMLIIKTNSILYHDVVQILQFIVRLKLGHGSNAFQNESLPFTHKRIQRTIKQLRRKIEGKIKQLKNLEQNHWFQSSNCSDVFQDLTNQALERNRIYKNCQKINSGFKNIFAQNQVGQILSDTLKQTAFFEEINQQFHIFLNHSEDTEKLEQIFESFFKKIKEIEILFIDKLENTQFQSIRQAQNGFEREQDEKQNKLSKKAVLNPQKSVYPMMKNVEDSKNSINQQVAEDIEFTYIEGIPFPTNRRSIDFSMLQLTDDLLLNYLPALQKFKELEEICIRKNKLSPISYRLLKNIFPALRSIDLRQNVITEEIIEILLCFKHLNILYLSECQINPVLLIKICLNLHGINVLYCDRLTFTHSQTESSNNKISIADSDLRGIFYIMCLNLKKLMYFSIKGYFSEDTFKYGGNFNSSSDKKLEELPETKLKEISIFSNIYETLKKRHGILEI